MNAQNIRTCHTPTLIIINKLGLSTKNAEGVAPFELEELKLLEKKSMGCGSRICFSKTFISSTGHRQHEAPNKSPER